MTRYHRKKDRLSLGYINLRFSIGGKKKEEEDVGESSESEQKQSRSRNPFLGNKSRVPQSQSPGPGVSCPK